MKGHYLVEGLGAGQYQMIAVGEGHQPVRGKRFELDENHTSAEVDLKLTPGGAVQVLVVDGAGEPVEAMVMLFDESGDQVNEGLPPLTANGVYRFTSLVPGKHTVRVVSDQKEPVTQSFTAVVGETAEVRVSLPSPGLGPKQASTLALGLRFPRGACSKPPRRCGKAATASPQRASLRLV